MKKPRRRGQAEPTWFVMRDLKRRNACLPAWKMLSDAGFEVFTPMEEVLTVIQGKHRRILRPYIQDLLFVKSTRVALDPVVNKTPTLQYRFAKGMGYMEPMFVPDKQMEDFMTAVMSGYSHTFISPQELSPAMIGKMVRIIGGPMNGFTGHILSLRGARKRKVLVEIPNLIAAAVEVEPEYIEIINKTCPQPTER